MITIKFIVEQDRFGIYYKEKSIKLHAGNVIVCSPGWRVRQHDLEQIRACEGETAVLTTSCHGVSVTDKVTFTTDLIGTLLENTTPTPIHMNEIQKAQLKMLNEVVEYFSADPIPRRNANDLNCQYKPFKSTSKGCAIGMYIEDVEIQKEMDIIGPIKFIVKDKPQLLPKWMLELGGDFLSEVQQLHDGQSYWNRHGLTPLGETIVSRIKDKYGLDETQ